MKKATQRATKIVLINSNRLGGREKIKLNNRNLSESISLVDHDLDILNNVKCF